MLQGFLRVQIANLKNADFKKEKEVIDLNRKAQGLSLNVIIIAVLALLVLIVLSILLLNRMTKTDKDLKACALEGGKCVAQRGAAFCPSEEYIDDASCPDDTKPVCCKRELLTVDDNLG